MKLNYKRTFFVGLAFMSICAFWQMYDSIIPLVLKNTFGIGDTVSGSIMAIDNVLALFMLPLFGALSDKVNTSIGKRTPFIIGGTIAAVCAMLFIPYADNSRNFSLFIISLCFVLIAMATYRSPAVALMPDVTPKPLRSKANAVINLMGALGGIVSLGLIAALVPKLEKPNYLPIFAIVAALMVIAVVILLLTIREKKLSAEVEASGGHSDHVEMTEDGERAPMAKEVRRSLALILISVSLWFMGYNAVTTAFSKYAQGYWHLQGGDYAYSMLIGTGVAVLSYIPVGMISTKFGRKKTIMAGIIILFTAYIAAFSFTTFYPIVNVLFGLTGIGWAAINVNSYPMVVEMAKGSDVGKYTGYYYTFSMSAQILTPILSGALLEYVGYRTLFPYAAVFSALAFCTMSLVKHGDSKPSAPSSKLEMYDTDD